VIKPISARTTAFRLSNRPAAAGRLLFSAEYFVNAVLYETQAGPKSNGSKQMIELIP
jgi:hypothetical protein